LDTIDEYRGFKLDPFQTEAIKHINHGESVVVTAPTGTGKTLVADYVIENSFRQGKRVIYTAPIKALSNQKFKEFKRLLGEEHVGILTGDIVINPQASVLIMTTEIFRNILHTEVDRVSDVAYVIFDEIHYIDDPSRGSVWEESLIFMPPHMRFLGLSATIPNVDELANWIKAVQNRPVHVVYHNKRAVPLEHHFFEKKLGITTREKVLKRAKRISNRRSEFSTNHLNLLEEILPEYSPILFFTFSRRRCETHAHEAASIYDLVEPRLKKEINEVIDSYIDKYKSAGVDRLDTLRPLLLKGIGYHHAGMLPILKDIVEELFETRKLKLLYCTETFAVGLNFPCKTVCFDSVSKWDGVVFRPLKNREYFQMAGRAGRRGMDERGYVFSIVNFNYFSPKDMPSFKEEDVEPLKSKFFLSYNSVLNMVKRYTQEEIISILSKNFASFQAEQAKKAIYSSLKSLRRFNEEKMSYKAAKKIRRQRAKLNAALHNVAGAERFHEEFEAKKMLLEGINYLEEGKVTSRGEFASWINGQELLVTELFFKGLFHDLSEDQVNALAVAIGYEPRRLEMYPSSFPFNIRPVLDSLVLINKMETAYLGYDFTRFYPHMATAAMHWSMGASLGEVLTKTQADEGDLIYALRRGIDILRQIRQAAKEDALLRAKLARCIEKLDRDEVSILL
jgi:superfamily II RNA helicase